MRRLVLLRHGKAESVSATGGDFDRALTSRGRRDAAIVGRALGDLGFAPDLVLVSSAARARQTWEAIADAFPSAALETSRALYLASREQLRSAVDAHPDAASVLLVGHNPGLHELALDLLGPNAASAAGLESFPTAAAAVFRFDADGRARLEAALKPRALGGGPG